MNECMNEMKKMTAWIGDLKRVSKLSHFSVVRFVGYRDHVYISLFSCCQVCWLPWRCVWPWLPKEWRRRTAWWRIWRLWRLLAPPPPSAPIRPEPSPKTGTTTTTSALRSCGSGVFLYFESFVLQFRFHSSVLSFFPVFFLDAFSHLYKRVCPSVRRSVRHTRVEFLRNGPNSNKLASRIRKYAI